MHVLYIHKNFPAQFGHLGEAFAKRRGWRITFASEKPPRHVGPMRRVQYHVEGSASSATHFTSVPFENYARSSYAVYDMLVHHRELRPDIVVAHSGFGTTLFLRDLLQVPLIHFSEWYYLPTGGDSEFTHRNGNSTSSDLKCKVRNAMLLADLDNCTVGYCPTHWQRSRIPHQYQHKLETIFDGIDTAIWRPPETRRLKGRVVGGHPIPDGKKVVTYVSRGFESMRGFDIFIRVANGICKRRSDVVFLCIGSDRVCYGNDLANIKENSFREHVLRREAVAMDNFVFTGPVPTSELVNALGMSDLHIYLTAPFILSWSLMNALACGCTVLASDTPPLREVVEHGATGLLAPYWDVQRLTDLACNVLQDPESWRTQLGQNGRSLIHSSYSLDVVLPRMEALYERALNMDTRCKEKPVFSSADTIREPTAAKRSSLVTPASIRRLRRSYPWPKGHHSNGRNRNPHPVSDLLGMDSRNALQSQMPSHARLIVELGSGHGLWTEWLAMRYPNTHIVAVDEWIGSQFASSEYQSWKSCLPNVWHSFVRRCGSFYRFVTPVKCPHHDAVPIIHSLGAAPQAILVHPDYDISSVRRVLDALAMYFPLATWVGMNWHWPRLQGELSSVTLEYNRRITVCGEVWRLDAQPGAASTDGWDTNDTRIADNSAFLVPR